MPDDSTSSLEACLQHLLRGEMAAIEEILPAINRRFEQFARRMLESYPATAAREEVDDVLQEFNLKLWSNLRNDPPPNVRVLFFRCAKLIRQTLIDMARKHRRREAEVAMPQPAGASSVAAWDPSDPTNAPHLLSKWGDLHEAIEHLPQELRETFDLLWYHGLTQGEAAAVLGVARETVNDRWRRARLDLHGVLGGDLPGM